MNITAEEKLMYSVMESIYSSGIPISFKGSMVLKACLLEAGYNEDTRHTVDIDANWNSDDYPTTEQIAESLQKAINKCASDLKVSVCRQYGEMRSAGFEILDENTEESLFTMDVDVNRPAPTTKLYEISGIRFLGVSPTQMIADKVCTVSTDKVFRRIKDVVDLYYISKVFKFEKTNVVKIIEHDGRTIESFEGFLNRTDELKHSYEKFRFEGGVDKPVFEEVYEMVKAFVKDIIPNQ